MQLALLGQFALLGQLALLGAICSDQETAGLVPLQGVEGH